MALMDTDISPEIRNQWLPDEQRVVEENKLLAQLELLNMTIQLSHNNQKEAEEEFQKFLSRGYDQKKGCMTPEGEWAIKSLINLGVAQYQEDKNEGRSQATIEETGKDGEKVSAEISIPINVGRPEEKLVRIRIEGTEKELYATDNKIGVNLLELRDMPDKIRDYGKMKQTGNTLKEQVYNQLVWEIDSMQSTEDVLDLILDVCNHKRGMENSLLSRLSNALSMWQQRSKLGMDSGTMGSIFYRLEAMGILEEGINFQKGYLLEPEGEIESTVKKDNYSITMKIPGGADKRDSGYYAEIKLTGNKQETEEHKKQLADELKKREEVHKKLSKGSGKIGLLLKTAKEYGIIWDKKENSNA